MAAKLVWGGLFKGIDECVLHQGSPHGYRFTKADHENAEICVNFLMALDEQDIRYFKPFEFHRKSILQVIEGGGFRCYSADFAGAIAGFFFLRLAANRRAYLGFVVTREHRRKGLGSAMVAALAHACDRFNIGLLSTVSKSNVASMKAHEQNGFVRVRELADGNLLLRLRRQRIK